MYVDDLTEEFQAGNGTAPFPLFHLRQPQRAGRVVYSAEFRCCDRVEWALVKGLDVGFSIFRWKSRYQELAHRFDEALGFMAAAGLTVSDKMDPNELVKLIEILNPENKAGRIAMITGMGAEYMRLNLPHLIRNVRWEGQIVTWVSDPMHGNTIKAPCGLKTRPCDAIWPE
ncbi:hypothetical protein ACLOJK_034014 [Asimina triloba]